MTYSNKLNDPFEILGCIDYAIVNDVDKDNILCIVDALLDYYRRGLQRGVTPRKDINKYIKDSGLGPYELGMQCGCDEVTLHDALEGLASLTYNLLYEMRSRVELI